MQAGRGDLWEQYKEEGYDLHAFVQERAPELMEMLKRPSIGQIRGPQNAAFEDDALPFVQDLIRSGHWSNVNEESNAGLRRVIGKDGKVQWLPRAQGGAVDVGAQDTGSQGLRGPRASDLIAWIAQADDEEEGDDDEEDGGAYLMEVLKGDGRAAAS